MIVDKVSKSKKNLYEITIDNESYLFDEEIYIKYRLVKGKEIDEKTLNKAILENATIDYYHKAIDYVYRYNKNSAEVYEYLNSKGLNNQSIAEIIDKLKSLKIIDDSMLANNICESLVKKANGRLMIEAKLKGRRFSDDIISNAIASINMDDYYKALSDLIKKSKDKYKKDEPFKAKAKLYKYLIGRGYTYSEVDETLV